jgi:UPF0755 protein
MKNLLLIAFLTLAFLSFLFYQWLYKPLVIASSEMTFQVPKGATMSSVANELENSAGLEYAWLFSLYSRVLGSDSELRPGEYELTEGINPRQLLSLLTSGKVRTYSLTFPEGITLAQAIDVLYKAPRLKNIMASALINKELAHLTNTVNPEGWFFPDTYSYTAETSGHDILKGAHRKMKDILAEEWKSRSQDTPYNNPYEALIMASIIEKETALASERPLIAGVFVARLKRGMRLQTDPTIIYGLGEEFDGNITRKHLADRKNVYNTYKIKGLPPTPIALPGRASISAALNPDRTASLYFVAKGDGSHYFSKTLAEHQKAVIKYQLKR